MKVGYLIQDARLNKFKKIFPGLFPFCHWALQPRVYFYLHKYRHLKSWNNETRYKTDITSPISIIFCLILQLI